MQTNLLCSGAALGFLIAAPVGPIGMLTISRTLRQGWRSGLLTGLGAATADAVYGFAAVCGLAGAEHVVHGLTPWLRIAGGAVLLWMGLKLVVARPSAIAAATNSRRTFASAFALTLANPMTVVSFAAILGAFGAANHAWAACMLVAGVFAGSVAWWLILAGAVAALSVRLGTRWLPLLNRVCGLLIVCFGLHTLIGNTVR